MDDNKNPAQNQTDSEHPVPLYDAATPPSNETRVETPVTATVEPGTGDADMQVEQTPDDVVLEAVGDGQPFVPVVESSSGDNRMKYVVIRGAIIFFILIFILLLWILFGRSSSTKARSATLIYWGLWEDADVMQPIFDDFEKANPTIKVEYQKMDPKDSYLQKIIARQQGGPDVFRFHNTWVPQMKEVLSPMPSSVMDASTFEQTFYPIHTKDLKIGNALVGMPLMTDGLVLIYNDALLRKAGKTSPPATLIDTIAYAGDLTIKDSTTGTIVLSTVALGTSENIEHFSDIFGLFLTLNGAKLTNLDSPEAAGALEEYRRFAEEPDATWNEAMPNSVSAFIQEKVAMIIAPSWELATIRAQNPQIEVKTAPVPGLPGAPRPLSLSSYWVEGVSRYSKFQPEAWKLLQYMSTPEVMQKTFELQKKSRFFATAYSRRDLGDTLLSDPFYGAVILQAKNDGYITLPMVTRTYDQGLNDEIVSYLEQAITQSANGVDYARAMKTAQSGVSQVLNKYNISE